MSNRLLSFVVYLSIVAFSNINGMSAMAQGQLDLTEKEVNLLITAAHKKAHDLGYDPKKMMFTLSKEGKLYKLFYYPEPIEGAVIYGGTLTIYLDKNGNVVRFIKGV